LGELADFMVRALFSSAMACVLLVCLWAMFKKFHGRTVLAQLINTVNGDRVDITAWESAIGRAKACDIVLNYSAVSRFHTVLARRNKGWMIFDTNSRTGLQVNGKQVDKRAYIYDGDILTVGNVTMCFRSPLFKRGKKAPARTEPERTKSAYTGEIPAQSEGRILSALQNTADGGIILLFMNEYIIGRDASCDIALPVITVSRQHARLSEDTRGWSVSDLGSKSGTPVNGKKITSERILRDGDIIEVGGISYKFIESYMRE